MCFQVLLAGKNMKLIENKKEVSLKGLSLLAKDLRGLFKKPQGLLLSGSLGTGKTTFTQVLLTQIISGEGQGLAQPVSPPPAKRETVCGSVLRSWPFGRVHPQTVSPPTRGVFTQKEEQGLAQRSNQRTHPQTVSPPPAKRETVCGSVLRSWPFGRVHPQTVSPQTLGSPAFSIQHVYGSDYGDIHHLDLYRLKDSEDLESTGFWDIFADGEKTYLVIIEWADRLNLDCLPLAWNYIKLRFLFGKNQGTRNIEIWR